MQLDHHHRPTLDSVLLSHTSFGHDLSVQFTYCLMVCFRSECPPEKYCAAVAVHHKHCSVNFFHSIVCSISVFVTSHHLDKDKGQRFVRYFLTTTRHIAQAQAHLLLPFILPHGTHSICLWLCSVYFSPFCTSILLLLFTPRLCVVDPMPWYLQMHAFQSLPSHYPVTTQSLPSHYPVTTQSLPSHYPVTTQTIIHV